MEAEVQTTNTAVKEALADALSESVSSEDSSSSHLGLPIETAFESHNSPKQNDGDASEMAAQLTGTKTATVATAASSANDDQNKAMKALEDRVKDLENKLVVLSRLLRLQRAHSGVGRRPSPTELMMAANGIPEQSPDDTTQHTNDNRSPSPPLVATTAAAAASEIGTTTPPRQIENSFLMYKNDSKDTGQAAMPYLESPARFLGMEENEVKDTLVSAKEKDEQQAEAVAFDAYMKRSPPDMFRPPDNPTNQRPKMDQPANQRPKMGQRNLSFRLLYGGDEEQYQQQRHTDPSATASMTPFERRWLGNMFLRSQREEQHQEILQQRHQSRLSSLSLNMSLERSGPDENVRHKWLNYLNSFQESTLDVDIQMEEFVKVPSGVESIMAFGFYICVDSFLYVFTILPIRFVWSCLLLLARALVPKRRLPPALTFHRRHTYQLIQVFMLYIIYTYVLAPISIGKLYHWIRGQAMIKLYVLIAMVEVFDRLMCSLGQDCLDSMYWNAVNRPKSSRMLISVAVVLLYSTCHTLLLFLHVATLNVAMNSADQALLTLFISGNFAEIKSTVFKKYNKPALFKLTANDVCERFKLGLFLGLVLLLNMCQGMDQGQFLDYGRVCAIVWCAELLADWLKHAFIIKFNLMQSKVYIEYALLLAGDFTGIGHEGVNLDHSHAVVKRIGFAQLPLVCVTCRMLREAAKYATLDVFGGTTIHNITTDDTSSLSWHISLGLAGGWLILLALKVALGSLLQRISLQKLRHAPEIVPSSKKKKS